jgi:hypothetical protein
VVRTGAGTASSIAALVFRYSVVPETYAAPNMIEAPAMPSNDAHAEFQKDTGAGEQSACGAAIIRFPTRVATCQLEYNSIFKSERELLWSADKCSPAAATTTKEKVQVEDR